MCGPMKSRRGQYLLEALYGFSVMELAITLTLLGLVGSYSVRYLAFSPRSIRTPTQAQRVLQDLRFAQHSALALQKTFRIVFGQNSYRIMDLAGHPIGHFRQKQGTFTLPSGMRIASPIPSIQFNSQGRPLREYNKRLYHPLLLTVSDAQHQATVVIEPMTGYTHRQ